ncbi:Vitamin B12 ABC transporter, permease component BtuC [Lachnospiraceae bacterium TWA4]|nr:Vitamin B12 ABC transporter, permease component BtuC [Lachnospiraceae bacterium TWA4]
MKRKNYVLLIIGLVALLVGAVFLSLFAGRYSIAPAEVLQILASNIKQSPIGNKDESILLNIRLPRILLNILVGGGLAIAGTAFQGVFQNPLVSPDVLSVSSGSAFGAVLGIMISASAWMTTGLALSMGILSLFLTYGLSKLGKSRSILNLILAGMIMTALFNALTSFMKYIADTETQLPEITYWLMGSFSGTTYKEIKIVVMPILGGAILLYLMRHRINLLSLGDEEAISLGINPSKSRFVVLLAATLVTASCVTVTGIIGWVGLVIPHICRMLVGSNHSKIIGLSFLIGAIFMTLVDMVSRVVVATEIPIGILTAIIGAPFFAFVFWKAQGE